MGQVGAWFRSFRRQWRQLGQSGRAGESCRFGRRIGQRFGQFVAKSAGKSGPTRWRGNIEGRGQIELVIERNHVSGRDIGGGGQSLGAGTFSMTGDGKTGNM